MSRRLLHIVLFLVLASPPTAAQSESDFSLVSWNGGYLEGDFRLGLNMSGTGAGTGTFSRVFSALGRTDAAEVFANPAALSFLEAPQLGFGMRLPIANGSIGFGSRSIIGQGVIRTRTDNLLAGVDTPDSKAPVYTQARRVQVGQPRQLTAFWVGYPVNEHVSLAFGYRQPLLFDSGFRISGVESLLSGVKESESQFFRVDFQSELDVDASARVDLREISFGIGGRLEDYYPGTVWWGASLYRYGAEIEMNLEARPQGLIVVSGSEQYFFNDTSDPNLDFAAGETNRFGWRVLGAYRGSAWGLRLGGLFHSYTGRYGLSLVVNIPTAIHLRDGDAAAESYMPVFLNLGGDDDGDIFDIEALDLSRPNLTERSKDAIGQRMTIELPVSVLAGLDVRLGRHILSMNAVGYRGNLALKGKYGIRDGRLQEFRIGKSPSVAFRMGLDIARRPGWQGTDVLGIPFRILSLDLDGVLFEALGKWTGYANPHFRISGGVLLGDAVVEGLDNTVSQNLSNAFGRVLPTGISLGRTYTLRDRMQVGVTALAVPDLVFRFSLGIRLD